MIILLVFLLSSFLLESMENVKNIENDFFKAVKEGNVQAVAAFLQKGIDVNLRDGSGKTALFYAVSRHVNNVEMIKMLINQPAIDPNILDNSGDSAISYACMYACAQTLGILLSHSLIEYDSNVFDNPNTILKNKETIFRGIDNQKSTQFTKLGTSRTRQIQNCQKLLKEKKQKFKDEFAKSINEINIENNNFMPKELVTLIGNYL